jgi:hypothetical protein
MLLVIFNWPKKSPSSTFYKYFCLVPHTSPFLHYIRHFQCHFRPLSISKTVLSMIKVKHVQFSEDGDFHGIKLLYSDFLFIFILTRVCITKFTFDAFEITWIEKNAD